MDQFDAFFRRADLDHDGRISGAAGEKEVSVYKENVEKQLRDANRKVTSLTDEKDNLMKEFEETVSANKSVIESLESKIRESENFVKTLTVELEIRKKEEDLKTLKLEIAKNELVVLEFKFKEREKQLEDQRAKTQKLLVEAHNYEENAKKHYDEMLESNKLELSRYKWEISQKNDQAINEVRRKLEVEKWEFVNVEKEKAEKAVTDMKRKYDEKLSECIEKSEWLKRACVAWAKIIQQENDKQVENLKSNHREELERVHLQAENKFKEKTQLLNNQHEADIKKMKVEREEECRRLQEELNIQKNKEYEVEASLGRTITKRRKTESSIMFQDPTKNKRGTPKTNTPRDVITHIRGWSQEKPVNISDLYADDPYAFS